jgi:cytoskeletal protein RodZ
MKETILQTDFPAADEPETRLPNPHFDDKTVATAQPVEPLRNVRTSSRPQRLGSLGRYLSLTAVLVAAVALVTVVTFAVVLASVHQRLNTAEPEAAIKPLEQPVQTESSNELSEQNSRQRSKPRKLRLNLSQARPVARKVGVIYY